MMISLIDLMMIPQTEDVDVEEVDVNQDSQEGRVDSQVDQEDSQEGRVDSQVDQEDSQVDQEVFLEDRVAVASYKHQLHLHRASHHKWQLFNNKSSVEAVERVE